MLRNAFCKARPISRSRAPWPRRVAKRAHQRWGFPCIQAEADVLIKMDRRDVARGFAGVVTFRGSEGVPRWGQGGSAFCGVKGYSLKNLWIVRSDGFQSPDCGGIRASPVDHTMESKKGNFPLTLQSREEGLVWWRDTQDNMWATRLDQRDHYALLYTSSHTLATLLCSVLALYLASRMPGQDGYPPIFLLDFGIPPTLDWFCLYWCKELHYSMLSQCANCKLCYECVLSFF